MNEASEQQNKQKTKNELITCFIKLKEYRLIALDQYNMHGITQKEMFAGQNISENFTTIIRELQKLYPLKEHNDKEQINQLIKELFEKLYYYCSENKVNNPISTQENINTVPSLTDNNVHHNNQEEFSLKLKKVLAEAPAAPAPAPAPAPATSPKPTQQQKTNVTQNFFYALCCIFYPLIRFASLFTYFQSQPPQNTTSKTEQSNVDKKGDGITQEDEGERDSFMSKPGSSPYNRNNNYP